MKLSLNQLREIYKVLDVLIEKELPTESRVEAIRLIDDCEFICLQDPSAYSELELSDLKFALTVLPLLIIAEIEPIYLQEALNHIKSALKKNVDMVSEVMFKRFRKGEEVGDLDHLPRDVIDVIEKWVTS